MSDYKRGERAACATAARTPNHNHNHSNNNQHHCNNNNNNNNVNGNNRNSSSKPSKPFCSLAYLAKSTITINGSDAVRIVKAGCGNNSYATPAAHTPHVAATAKVSERSSPALPTGASTAVNGHHEQNGHGKCNGHQRNGHQSNGHQPQRSHNATPTPSNDTSPMDTSSPDQSLLPSVTDVFGIINEEDATPPLVDQVDGTDLRRPWELGGHNGFMRRIPPALMTPAHAQNGHSGLPSLSKLSSMDCWDYTMELECLKGPQDLQLAAELGKTLLERNKELETLVKELRTTIDEQQQEIVYLKKHTNALREVNDTRLKVYEQLDIGIQELERANQRLTAENTNDKKHIKTLVQNIETLEARQDELTKQLDELRQALSMERRKNERLSSEKQNCTNADADKTDGLRLRSKADQTANGSNGNESSGEMVYDFNTLAPESSSFAFRSSARSANSNANSTCISTDNSLVLSDMMVCSGEDNEEIIKLVNDLETMKKAFMAEQQRCAELEEQLVAIIQENQTLQSRLANNSPNEEMRSMHEELSILDEVRQGKMCSRCLRVVEERGTIGDEQSSLAPTEECDEDEDRSLLDNASECSQAAAAYRAGVSIKAESNAGTTICPICSAIAAATANNNCNYNNNNSIKYSYLPEQLPISLEAMLLQLWQKTMRKFNVVSSRVADSLDLNIPGSPNPYRDLVEKYEALLEVQCSAIARKNINGGIGGGGGGGMSLAEEFQSSGEYSQSQKSHSNSASADGASLAEECGAAINQPHSAAATTVNGTMEEGNGSTNFNCNVSIGSNKLSNASNSNGKDMRGRTPTEFSEAETSSSGYADETSNKSTQTENRPGSFLCTIGDGEVCKFSIYDDASPIESHFRNRPEYKELFKEIFGVLKKAAANKEEGEKLPLLDDTEPTATGAVCPNTNNSTGNNTKVPPVTPANEELPPLDFCDDTQSIISSAVSEQSFAMSECITKMERKTAKKHIIEKNQENQPPLLVSSSTLSTLGAPTTASQIVENGRVLTPLKREPLEYLSVGVGIKKKNRRKNRNFSGDRAESPATLPSPPRYFISSGKKRRDVRPYVQSPLASATAATPEQGRGTRATGGARYEWNGSSMIIYNRSHNTPIASGSPNVSASGREMDFGNLEYRPSFLSMELHQLKKLDMSYAEVLRSADSCKHKHCQAAHHHHQHQHQHQQLQQPQTPKQHRQQKQHRNRKN